MNEHAKPPAFLALIFLIILYCSISFDSRRFPEMTTQDHQSKDCEAGNWQPDFMSFLSMAP